ncbi:undecaprenyl-phosphate glucose phosphotransferase [uncultured Bradyrhizobium sp.]|jgi:Undecaprenyl-phosphate glucose phosphotransferase|uniref:undecaprenyl-phosphate glucose phosphotransferase n=1 Tax=uncultured Bradyrhizobium sp. TaxID=199684 RepID=UPI00260D1655|nr:undecaprenyl-phosphate glucose phosphotransferase [uncultured Bradyrhizobium sp.]
MSKVPGFSRVSIGDPLSADPSERSSPVPLRKKGGFLRPQVAEATVAAIDVLLIVAAGLISSSTYYWLTGGSAEHALPYGGLGLIIAVNFVAIMTARRNYRLKNLMRRPQQAREIMLTWSGLFGLLAVVAFTMKISSDFSRGATIIFFTGGIITLLGWRYIVAHFISRSLTTGLFAQKRIIVIAEEGEANLSRALRELLSYGYAPIKTYDISKGEITSPGIAASLTFKLQDLIQLARSEHIQDVYLLVDWRNDRIIDGILSTLCVLPISVHLLPDGRAARFLSYPAIHVGDTWTALLQRAPLTRAELIAKRCFDLVFASTGVVLVLPLLLAASFFIILDSRGPILFRQKRDGFNGDTFEIFKLRTMHVLENGPQIKQATRNDPRVTRVGRLLRKSSIDELPQLFNVIRGDMSLVGPRPHAISHNSEYEQLIANYAFRHHVKPGLTGWAQVNGYRGETYHIEQMTRRVEHDLWYINHWSLWLDLKIVIRTLIVLLRQPDAY